jgi:HK97 family phage prohead protease
MHNENEIIKRFLPSNVQIRAVDGKESRTIEGYAIVFDKWSENLGWYIEKIDPRALDGVDLSRVIATVNHNFDKPLARANKGTLILSIDEVGLKFSLEAPNTTAGNDALEDVRNGNLDGCSFIFRAKTIEWEWNEGTADNPDKRTIKQFAEIIELGPVTMPAYLDTSVSARDRNSVMKEARPLDTPVFNTEVLDLRMKMSNIRNKI